MKLKSILLRSFGIAVLFLSPLAAQPAAAPAAGSPAPQKRGELIRVNEEHATWAAKERAAYPLDVCLTSDEKLGSMGKSPEYIYRVAGEADRLVVFCCAGCDEDFLKDPATHLAKLDAAKTKKKAQAK